MLILINRMRSVAFLMPVAQYISQRSILCNSLSPACVKIPNQKYQTSSGPVRFLSFGTSFQSDSSTEPFHGSSRPVNPPPLYENHKILSQTSKLVLFLKSTLQAAADPMNANAVATTLDISSHLTLIRIHAEMSKSASGLRILSVKPKASTHMPDSTFAKLSSFPSNSFERRYFDFMSSHGFDPHHRPTVKVRSIL